MLNDKSTCESLAHKETLISKQLLDKVSEQKDVREVMIMTKFMPSVVADGDNLMTTSNFWPWHSAKLCALTTGLLMMWTKNHLLFNTQSTMLTTSHGRHGQKQRQTRQTRPSAATNERAPCSCQST